MLNIIKRSRPAALALAAAMLLSLCACTGHPPAAPVVPDEPPQQEVITDCPLTLDGLIAELNAAREARTADERDMEAYLPDYTSESFLADEFSDEEFDLLRSRPWTTSDTVSYDGAVEDTEYLFRILRTSYGAYTFYGGDEVFGRAKQNILSELKENYGSGLSRSAYLFLLLDNLSFIEDSHFALGYYDTGFEEQYYYYDVNLLQFRRDSRGYYAYPRNEAENNRRWYLDTELEKYMRVTIAESGELVYGLFALCAPSTADQLPGYIVLTSADGSRAGYTVRWGLLSDPTYTVDERMYGLSRDTGIPELFLRTYYLEDKSFDAINSYLNDAKTLRDEPALIVDLCGNTGGYDTISSMWLYSLTSGSDVGPGVGYAGYVSRMNDYVLSNNEDEIEELFDQLDFFTDYPDYWDETGEADGRDGCTEDYTIYEPYIVERCIDHVDQDRTIFAVFDKNTYSAGEMALFQFENMSNVVFVGVNSNGCLLTGGTNIDAPVWLPNSGIPLSFSFLIVTSDRMEGFDSLGFQPDIVLDPAVASERIAACWNYYKG